MKRKRTEEGRAAQARFHHPLAAPCQRQRPSRRCLLAHGDGRRTASHFAFGVFFWSFFFLSSTLFQRTAVGRAVGSRPAKGTLQGQCRHRPFLQALGGDRGGSGLTPGLGPFSIKPSAHGCRMRPGWEPPAWDHGEGCEPSATPAQGCHPAIINWVFLMRGGGDGGAAQMEHAMEMRLWRFTWSMPASLRVVAFRVRVRQGASPLPFSSSSMAAPYPGPSPGLRPHFCL